ncbi:hypothetical protein ANANG_G00316620 [Anguilla anguilla]|uniref:Uncharacterized protein n=1 Tax=Anguilla anguilla TaxID=7936 RepID=A0A9D3LHU3_ANGAN|nr:hypothetical protein ANANG_G00316620 [Anguilla anguilla]
MCQYCQGCCQVGILKALSEPASPWTWWAALSIGALMGRCTRRDRSHSRMRVRAREWAMEMTSVFKKVLDLTYPVTSMFSRRGLQLRHQRRLQGQADRGPVDPIFQHHH